MGFKEANSMTDAELAEVLDFADTVSGWVKSVRAEAYKRALRKSGCIPGWKMAAGNKSRDWAIEPENVPQHISAICPEIVPQLYTEALKSVPQVEALLKQRFKGRGHKKVWEAFKKLVNETTSASQTLVRDTDARPEVRRGHEFAKFATKAKTAEEDLL